ncbi:GntR family transcriptional regulator [Phytohabitans flavus]|uniref:GntR family transcriptional regulator n=1 Tax=Phytohabitans flavus TaxID=1076124 RepID=UPI0036431363
MVAEELRRRIEAGAIPAGALLPPESALVQEFGISRGTAREAIATLRAEGLVVTEHGRGTYARPQHPVRRLSADRYRPNAVHASDLPETSLRADVRLGEVSATPTLARLFGVAAGTPLLQRRVLFWAHGVPEQLAISNYLLSVVAGTPLTDPTPEPWLSSITTQLSSIGINVTKIRELVRARMPTAEEASALRLLSGVPVLALTRRTYSREQIIEVANEIVLPADRAEIEYEILPT